MDKIINNQGFHHIVENIFITLKHKDIIKILAPYESSTNIHYILKEFVRNQDIIDTLAPFEYN